MKVVNSIKRVIKYILYGVPMVKRVQANVVSLDINKMLDGRVALITGGTSGIGKAIAETFLKSGATVIITGRDESKINNVLNEIKNQNVLYEQKVFGVQLNNIQPSSFGHKLEEIIKLIKACVDEFEIVEDNDELVILVNNAGIGGGDISNTTEEEFDQVIKTNLNGTFFLSKIVSKYMIKNSIKGNILNIASSSSLRPAASAYTFSKWGIRGFTLGLAKTLAPFDITVNGLAPGPTATPMLHCDGHDISFEKNPMRRFAMPEEIANMAAVLVSDMGRMIVGDIVYMTGGAGVITFDDIEYNI